MNESWVFWLLNWRNAETQNKITWGMRMELIINQGIRKKSADTARRKRLYLSSHAEGVVNHTASEPHLFGHYHSGSWCINTAII